MAEQTQGLRFDIYERVHLSDDGPGIGQLEEVELLPRIQVVSRGEQVVLKGHLLLSGTFAAEHRQGSGGSLEHAIPVEIILPMNRVSNLENIAVEIENFDIDMVSPRTLNVTGVLSLHGLSLPASGDEWSGGGEEDVFVHERKEQEPSTPLTLQDEAGGTFQDPSPYRDRDADPAPDPEVSLTREAETAASSEIPSANGEKPEKNTSVRRAEESEEAWTGEPEIEDVAEAPKKDTKKDPEQAQDPDAGGEELFEDYEPADDPASERIESEQLPDDDADDLETRTEKTGEDKDDRKEVKIAFQSKPRNGEPEQASVKTLLEKSGLSGSAGNRGAVQAQKTGAESGQAREEARSAADAVEWKSLFLHHEEEPQFSSLRMCIVQKEETIETIAERYGLHPREILLYNRLGDSGVQEGQVIYIPKQG